MFPHSSTPAVTSKIPVKTALISGDLTAKLKSELKIISETAQAMIINAHILKQFSAADIMDSTMTAELLFDGYFGFEIFSLSLEKNDITAAINKEDISCAAKIKVPILILPKSPMPITPIRNEGPALTQKQSIPAAVFRLTKPPQTRSFIHFAAAGYPPIIAVSKTPPQIGGNLRSFVIGLKSTAKKSTAELLQINMEIAINGKSDGITEFEHIKSPRRIPLLISEPSKISKIHSAEAVRAVRKFFFVKKSVPFSES